MLLITSPTPASTGRKACGDRCHAWLFRWRRWALAVLLLGGLSVAAGCSDDQSGPLDEGAAYRRRIVALGDSLTAGYALDAGEAYPARLERLLVAADYAYRVINAGVSGETSEETLARVPQVVGRLQPDIVILETGANDGLRGVDPRITQRNLAAAVERLQAAGVVVVLAGMKLPPSLGTGHTRAFARIYPAIAQRYDLILMPFLLEGVAGDRRLNLRDGLHPNADGHERVARNLLPYVIEAISRVAARGA